MSNFEDKFNELYNAEKDKLTKLTNEQLLEHINELEKFILEARARLQACEDENDLRKNN
jgi:hypothetical protein